MDTQHTTPVTNNQAAQSPTSVVGQNNTINQPTELRNMGGKRRRRRRAIILFVMIAIIVYAFVR
jgi:hypothetical protein